MAIVDLFTLGRRLEQAQRSKTELSVQDIAQQLGVSHVAMYRWMNGKSEPGAILLARAAELCGTTPDALLLIDSKTNAMLDQATAGLDFSPEDMAAIRETLTILAEITQLHRGESITPAQLLCNTVRSMRQVAADCMNLPAAAPAARSATARAQAPAPRPARPLPPTPTPPPQPAVVEESPPPYGKKRKGK